MSLRKAAEMALEALEYSVDGVRQEYLTDWRHGLPSREAQLAVMREAVDRHDAAITALRAALAEADEPVAWRYKKEGGDKWHVSAMTPEEAREWNEIVVEEPLYTHPPRREPLTEDEARRLYRGAWTPESEANEVLSFARTVERAHGIGTDE